MNSSDPSSSSSSATHIPTSPSTDKPEIPWAFIDCSADTLVILIAHMLNLLIEHNDQVVLTPDALTRFHSRAAPGISVVEYLRRIVKYTNMEKIPLLSLLAYIDLTCAHLPTFTLSTLTVHRFLIAGVCAGSKAQCDVFCTNSHYAKVGGIKVGELNALEREFLRVTQWNLCCNADLLQRYYTSLIRSHGGFTQASAPATPPFRAFPRSISKPPAPEEEEDEGMEADELEEEGVDDTMGGSDHDADEGTVDGSSGATKEEEEMIRRRRKSVDEVLGVAAVPEGGQIVRGRRRKSSVIMGSVSPKGNGEPYQLASAIASSSTSSQTSNIDIPYPNRHSTQEQAISSSASSSIPSSSRSSIRGSSRLGARPPSMSNLSGSGRPAEAVVDRRHAGMQGTSTPDVLGGTVSGVSIPQIEASRRPGVVVEDEAGYGRASEDSTRTAGMTEPETSGNRTSDHGRILKNLVGVFKKRSSHPPPSSLDPTSSGHRPQSTILSRPLSSAPIHDDTPPSDKSPRRTSTLISRQSGVSSPRDSAQQMKSPGPPTSVTPRIRTRDERSVDSLHDRNGVGLGVGSE